MKLRCPECGQLFSSAGFKGHLRMTHGMVGEPADAAFDSAERVSDVDWLEWSREMRAAERHVEWLEGQAVGGRRAGDVRFEVALLAARQLLADLESQRP